MPQVWTDAGFNQDTKQAGLGVLIRSVNVYGIEEKRLKKTIICCDNNEAELQAILYGLKNLGDTKDGFTISIITDSRVAISNLLGYNNTKKYSDVCKEIKILLTGEKVKFYFKKGHTGNSISWDRFQGESHSLATQALRKKFSR